MRLGIFLLLAILATVATVTSVAQSTTAGQSATVAQSATSVGSTQKASPGKNKPKGSVKTLPGITPEREAAVMTFVKQHHPELSELLIHLKEHTPKEYDRAVR